MFVNVFKLGGPWKTKDGTEYTVKSVEQKVAKKMCIYEWFMSLEDAMAIEHESPEESNEEMGDYERSLRNDIKALGGTPGGRSKISTLEAQLKGLQNGDNNQG